MKAAILRGPFPRARVGMPGAGAVLLAALLAAGCASDTTVADAATSRASRANRTRVRARIDRKSRCSILPVSLMI